jgi:hypothetical protein
MKIWICDLRFVICELRTLALAICAATLILPATTRAEQTVTPQALSAVDRGLDYLAKKQLPSGSFPAGPMMGRSAAISSLAVMAFLSRGHVPGQGPYGDVVNRGIDFVMSCQQPDGLISATEHPFPMYDHGISTMMLCEVYGMVDPARRGKLDTAIAKAVKVIVDAQRVEKDQDSQGGWRYRPSDNTSDISVSGWQLMALRGAANAGAAVPRQTIEDGLAFIRRRASPVGGFTYGGSMRTVNAARTGTGILSLELLGKHASAEALAGGDYLLQAVHSPEIEHPYYAIYYCTQAANQLGGKYWDGIYIPLRDRALAAQNADGSWPAGTGVESQAGDVYATSMSILALTVPFRYLPLYQR